MPSFFPISAGAPSAGDCEDPTFNGPAPAATDAAAAAAAAVVAVEGNIGGDVLMSSSFGYGLAAGALAQQQLQLFPGAAAAAALGLDLPSLVALQPFQPPTEVMAAAAAAAAMHVLSSSEMGFGVVGYGADLQHGGYAAGAVGGVDSHLLAQPPQSSSTARLMNEVALRMAAVRDAAAAAATAGFADGARAAGEGMEDAPATQEA